MANTLTKLDIHLTFLIKHNGPTIRHNDISRLHEYIGGIVRSMGGSAIAIGGVNDHVHILLTLPKTISMSEMVKTIKARSSTWIKTIDPVYSHFAWQEGYGAFSVSPSLIEPTAKYIRNQEEHHRVHTFKEEYLKILQGYGITYDERYVFDD